MAFKEAISRLTVETVYKTTGADAATSQTRQLEGEQAKLIESSGKVETATGRMEQAWLKHQRALQLVSQQSQQIVSVNDNVARSFQAANDNADNAGKSIAEIGEEVLSATGHMKTLALIAYSLSPAFRSFANAGLTSAIGAMGPAAASAAGAIVSALLPAITMLARITIPIAVAVAAWKVLNSAVSQGAELLTKYGEAQRNLVSGVDDSLTKLTRFQDGNLSAEQVQRATELGARLNEARKTIADFFSVQLDLNDAGLKMQAIWVRIVELIAAAVDKLNHLPSWAVAMMLGAATGAAVGSVIPGVGTLIGAGAGAAAGLATNLTAGGGNAASNTADANALAVARQRLAAGMGSTSNFANRFGDSVNDLANVKNTEEHAKAVAKTRMEFDRLIDSVNRASAAEEANAQTINKSAAEQARLRTEFKLTEAANQDIAKNGGKIEDYYDRIQEAAKRAGDAAAALEKARVDSSIKFQAQTIGLSAEDVRIAQQLRGLYPDVTTALNSTEAAQMRLNNRLREMADAERAAFGNLISDLANAKNPLDALTNSFGGLATQMAKIGASNLFDALKSGDFSKLFNNSDVSLGGVAGVAGAGLNAYKSGSPLGGALGGLMAGLSTGNPVLALAGGAAGRVGNPFNCHHKEKQS